MVDTSPHKTLSDIIEERIREVKQKAIKWIEKNYDSFGCKRLYQYALALDQLYDIVKTKAPEVLPEIEELVKISETSEYYTHLFNAIREYIRHYIHLTDDKTRKDKIENLKEGLKLLLNRNVNYELRKLDWDAYMGKYLPELKFYIDKISKYLEDTTGKRLDIFIKWDIDDNAAYNYLSKYTECLLNNPKGYIQHMKAGDLEDFIKSCKP
jgi:hypothetical protein